MEPFVRRIRAGVPTDWSAKESLTLLAPDGQANVIVSSEPLRPEIDVGRYALVQGGLLAQEFSGFREQSFEPAVVFGGRGGFIRQFSWMPPDGVAVRQIQIYAVEDGRGFTATCTTPDVHFARFEPLFEEVIANLNLDAIADELSGGAH